MTANAIQAACAPQDGSVVLDAAPPRPMAEVIVFPRMAGVSVDDGAPASDVDDAFSRYVDDAFSRYVSPQVVERLMADPRLTDVGGETREITVLFADIRGFTALAEAMEDDPQRLARVINAILSPLSEIVMAHGGTIDKYMGDSVMAFWGAPADDPDHADNAVQAACAMLGAMPHINARLRRAVADNGCFPPMSIGIGVNSGKCVVGNVGCTARSDYSVLGDPVNVASRLEGLSKSYGVSLLIGEATAKRLTCAETRLIDRIAVRGRVAPQGIFTLN